MASRKSASPHTLPSLAGARARSLLDAQFKEAVALAAGTLDPFPKEWLQTTRAIVVGAFGEPSDAVQRFDRPPSAWSFPLNPSPQQAAAHRRNLVLDRVEVLKSCIKQLDMGIGGASVEPSEAPLPSFDEVGAALAFVADDEISLIIRRDLDDLAKTLGSGAWKPALLLCGSVLEAVFVDVLDRNPPIASSYMGKKKFPDDASLHQLIDIASKEGLLSPTAAGFAGTITEHRDLIHPHSEVRNRIKVDKTTAEGLVHLLRLVVRDLADAETSGAIAAYVAK